MASQSMGESPLAIKTGEQVRNPQADKVPVLSDSDMVKLFYDHTERKGETFRDCLKLARKHALEMQDPGIPEKDRKVTIEGIQDYVLKHRERYLSALVRMVQRWLDAGKPEGVNTHRMRQWSRVVRGIMQANGFGRSFLENSDAVMLSASPDFTLWTNAFKEIVAQLGDRSVEGWTLKDVFLILSFEKEVYAHEKDVKDGRSFTRLAQGQGLLNELIGNAPSDQARKVKLGQLLRSKVGAVYGGFKLIDLHKSRKGAKLYALEGVGDGGESTPF